MGNIADIRGLKIVSEQGIASGVRRIEAVAGSAFIEYVNARDAVVKQLSATLKVWVLNVLHSAVATTPYFRMFFSPVIVALMGLLKCLYSCRDANVFYKKRLVTCVSSYTIVFL